MSLMARSTRRKTLWLLALVVALVPHALSSRASAGGGGSQTTYSLINLGTPHDGYGNASGINASGQVIGTCDITGFLVTPEDTDGDAQADLWFRDEDQDGDNDLMIELPGLEGEGQNPWTEPAAINDRGHVVGHSYTDEWNEDGSSYVPHALVWTPQGGMIDLDSGSWGDCIYSYATDINNHGQIVGRREVRGQWHHGFLITPETDESGALVWFRDDNDDGENDLMIDLGPCYPGGINDAGQIAGSAEGCGFLLTPQDTDGDGVPDRWFRDDNNDGVNDLMVELPPLLGHVGSSAGPINASGQVVGTSSPPPKGGVHTWAPVLWEVDAQGQVKTTDIGKVPGEEATGVSDINDAGQVVGNGYSWPTGPALSGGSNTGFLWQNGTMTRFRNLIGDAGGFDTRPYLWTNGINNAGLIVGRGITDGHGRPFIALPSGGTEPPPTPGISVEPASGLVTTEAGDSDTFTIVLKTQPAAAVTIGLSSSDATEGTVAPASVIFDAANWDTPQTVTVTGVDDAAQDGDVAYSIVTAAAVSSDPDYSGLNAADVGVTNQDDEAPPAPTTVTVTSITYATEGGRNSDKHLLITVAVEDDLGNAVPGASVSIAVSLDGQHYANDTATTGADGTVTFRLGNAPSGTYTTEVTAVTAAQMTWDGLTPENAYTK